MGRAPCCDKAKVKKGPWSPEEDEKLKDYMHTFGTGCNWIALPQKAGLKRCGKSCRLRWLNYLRPNIKHGEFSDEEDRLILSLFSTIGSRWSIIAAQLPGRTDNDIKNYWNTKLKKKLIMGMSNNHKFPHLLPQKMKPNTTYHHQMLLHNSPRSQSPLLLSPAVSSTSPYNTTGANYYNTPSSSTLSFTGFDQSTTHGLLQQMQSSNYLVFGGATEPSCSSSDGSFYTTKHHHQHDHMCAANSGDEQGIKFDQKCSYFYNGSSSVVEDDDQKNINSDSLIWENTPSPLMDYDGLEEIKQLISSTTTTTTSNSFYFDENKAGERGMMYY